MYAWAQTSGAAGFQNIQPPTGDLVWGTVSTKGATTLIHVDDDGLGTSTQLLTGCKYWVSYQRDPRVDVNHGAGNMRSVAFRDHGEWEDQNMANAFYAEAITLRPRMIL